MLGNLVQATKAQQIQSLVSKLLKELQLTGKLQVILQPCLIQSFSYLSIREWRIKLKLAIASQALHHDKFHIVLGKKDFECLMTQPKKR